MKRNVTSTGERDYITVKITASRNFLGEDYSYLLFGNDEIGMIELKPGESIEKKLPTNKGRVIVSVKQHPALQNTILCAPNESNRFIIGPGNPGVSVSKIA